MKKLMLGAMFALFLFSGLFAANQPLMIVNSYNYEDVIGGAVYAAEMEYQYAFVLTEAHADYWFNMIKDTDDQIYYYESTNPVSGTLKGKMTTSMGSNLIAVTDADLSGLFARKADGNLAVVVGRENGAEALSVAPYVAQENGGLYFSNGANAGSLITSLKSSGKKVLVYGSIADNAGSSALYGTEVINEGSVYQDNAKILSKFDIKEDSQVIVASGKTFEKTLVSDMYPIAIVGRTEVPQELLTWILTSGVNRGMVFQGDANIDGAIASIRKGTGLPIFVKLSEGFSGDAKVQPLAVMPLPTPNVMLNVHSVNYVKADKSFETYVVNKGSVPAHVRVAVTLGDGTSSTSRVYMIGVGKSRMVPVSLDGDSFVRGAAIPAAEFQIYSGQDSYFMEAIDVIRYTDIEVVEGSTADAILPPDKKVEPKECPPAEEKVIYKNAEGDAAQSILLYVMAAVMLLILGILLMQSRGTSEKSSVKEHSHHKKHHKKK